MDERKTSYFSMRMKVRLKVEEISFVRGLNYGNGRLLVECEEWEV